MHSTIFSIVHRLIYLIDVELMFVSDVHMLSVGRILNPGDVRGSFTRALEVRDAQFDAPIWVRKP